MANIISLSGKASAFDSVGASARPPAVAGSELAKLERQLSDWVHCPSCNTSAGKAKISEITTKIDGVKAQIKKAEQSKVEPAPETQAREQQAIAKQGLRFDGLGASLNVQA